MGFIIGVLTAVLVLDSLLLMLLILIQLPKKEAGVGQAFGGAATDALFGAGGGNALTKMTKYAAVVFFVLAFGLSVIISKRVHKSDTRVRQALQQQAATPVPAAATGASNVLQSLVTTNVVESARTNSVSTNTPAQK
ncbi:MAG TPA: preprotein translocase subunit SecG [Candidatus Paceibacterota bacterium]|nr:preprotein translocase subunit SecG [Verrucomicrobiota bacterium]HRY50225.1 preprotein translocase subunit SecG [Candidatus Paceibacterota bacterium]HRZ99366.1 preprotein translocase subunit SecG [Candidatus Paceibacterota bacterium]